MRSDKTTLTPAEWEELLQTDWASELLLEIRPGFEDFCIAIVCDKSKAKD